MAKKKLLIGKTADERSFLERLTIAYAPIDMHMMQSTREISCQQSEEADTSDRKLGLGVKFAVRHLGSI